jgi:hypothetical protein
LRYVQVSQLKKPVTKKYLDVTLYGNPAEPFEFLSNHTLSKALEQQKMSLKHVQLFAAQTNRKISERN